ncbi:MAG: transposase [Flavobacteriaceae bacterium]|nr:transposase [Flavobacteriaceae bacterium]
MVEHKTPRIHALSSDRNEYDRSKTLLDNSLKEVLDDKKVSEALKQNSIEKFSGKKRVYVPSDHCDIRKRHSWKMENIGKVLDLNKKVINGFTTLASVAIDENKHDLTLMDVTVFSNREDRFIKQDELELYKKEKIKDEARVSEIKRLVDADEHINMTLSLMRQTKSVSETLKLSNPAIVVCHIHDRFADMSEYFEHIDQTLKDEFVIRGTAKRVSNQTKVDEKGKTVNVKLIDSEFQNRDSQVIEKLRLKGKLYQQAESIIEWDSVEIEGHSYTTVRITLKTREGKNIFKKPMLLISNIKVNSYIEAKEIYHIYLLRSKIEAVFKFLKDVLGWEEFQVRDWESIKNIIALCFFVGNYFYEIESTLIEHPTIEIICQLGDGKGKVSRFYFLKGLEKLLIAQSVFQFKEDREISDDEWSEITDFAGIGE